MRHDDVHTSDDPITQPRHLRPIELVREGMDVIARSGEKIGTVKDLRIGDPGDPAISGAPERAQNLIGSLAEAFGNRADPDVPDGLRERYLRRGYLKVNTGVFGSDRYALADQIADVRGDRVHLSVDEDGLIEEGLAD